MKSIFILGIAAIVLLDKICGGNPWHTSLFYCLMNAARSDTLCNPRPPPKCVSPYTLRAPPSTAKRILCVFSVHLREFT